MRAALFSVDVIDISINVFVVGIGILQSDLNDISIFFALDINWLFVNRGLTAIYVIDEGNNAAFVMENLALVSAFIAKFDFNALV